MYPGYKRSVYGGNTKKKSMKKCQSISPQNKKTYWSIRVFRLEPDIAILYRFVLQNEKTKYYPTPSGNRTQAPWLQFQHAPFWATEACAT